MRRFAVLFALLAVAADWPQYLGPTRDGHAAVTLAPWPAAGPKTLWAKDVGAGFAGAVVADGRGYLFHRVGNDEVIRAFDPATGADGWLYSRPTKYVDDFGFDPGPRATPLVAGGRVFALGPNGDLHAADAATGKPLWHRNLIADYRAGKGYFGAACSPLLADGKLVLQVGGPGAGVVAFDPATGKELWKSTSAEAGYASPVVADVGGKPAIVCFTRPGLKVLDPATGAVRFEYPFRARIDASVNAATPLVFNGDVFLTSSYSTGAVLLRPKGDALEEVWASDKAISSHYNTPVRVGEYVYGVHGRAEGGGAELRCVVWATGEVKWTQPRFGCASLIAAGTEILAVTEAGELVRFAADAGKYTETARAKVLDGVTRAAPAVAGGRVYVRDDKRLVCVEVGK